MAQIFRDRADTFVVFNDASTISADLDAMTEVTAVIDDREITCCLQPVVRLDSSEIIGYEAFARGPAGTRWESPGNLFHTAAAIGKTSELDWICRARAIEQALHIRLDPAAFLFVNTDPATPPSACPADLRTILDKADGHIRLMVEISERVLTRDPAIALTAVKMARQAGHGICLDNVGTNPDALAFLSIIRPDIIKLDGYLLGRPLHPQTARVVEAVDIYVAGNSAIVAATGIETYEHLHVARSMGAVYGQGWLLGRPQHTPAIAAAVSEPTRVMASAGWGRITRVRRLRAAAKKPELVVTSAGKYPVTPFMVASSWRKAIRAPVEMILALARRMESCVFWENDPSVLLVCAPQMRYLSEWMWLRYSGMASRSPLVAIFGHDLSWRSMGVLGKSSESGVENVDLEDDDPLVQEWNVIVLGPRRACALIAKVAVEETRLDECRYDYIVTHDRGLIGDMTRVLIERLTSRDIN